MAKCDKCDGKGWKDNPKYWNAKAKYQTDWYLHYKTRVNCKTCKGTGYVIGDVMDAIDVLKVWKNNPNGITNKDFKQAIEILEKIFDKNNNTNSRKSITATHK